MLKSTQLDAARSDVLFFFPHLLFLVDLMRIAGTGDEAMETARVLL